MLAKRMHQTWVEETIKEGTTEKFKPVPGTEIMSDAERIAFLTHNSGCRVKRGEGATCVEQNIVQDSARIHPALMEKLNGAVARDYLGAVLGAETREEAAARIHDVWAQHNDWQREKNPQLFVPYKDLPENEKDKDRIIAGLAMSLGEVKPGKELQRERRFSEKKAMAGCPGVVIG